MAFKIQHWFFNGRRQQNTPIADIHETLIEFEGSDSAFSNFNSNDEGYLRVETQSSASSEQHEQCSDENEGVLQFSFETGFSESRDDYLQNYQIMSDDD